MLLPRNVDAAIVCASHLHLCAERIKMPVMKSGTL